MIPETDYGHRNTWHVYPNDDLIEHDTEHGGDCICGPEVEAVKRDDGSFAYIVVHHSLDGREKYE